MKFSQAMIDVMTAVFPRGGDKEERRWHTTPLRDYAYDIHKNDTRRLAAAIQLEEMGFVRIGPIGGSTYTIIGFSPSQRS